MKIISWNSHYGFDSTKQAALRAACPEADVYVIQECEKTDFDGIKNDWKYKNWYSDDLNAERSQLGVAIFSKEYTITFTPLFNRSFRYVIPYEISCGKERIILFAVWTKSMPQYYEKNVTAALESGYYEPLLSGNVVIIGDFNTGANGPNHGDYAEQNRVMRTKGLINAAAKDGEKEFTHTYQHTKNSYVNDFCYVSESLCQDSDVTVFNDWDSGRSWQGLSDHCPIMLEIQANR